jgi:hypothetical protein
LPRCDSGANGYAADLHHNSQFGIPRCDSGVRRLDEPHGQERPPLLSRHRPALVLGIARSHGRPARRSYVDSDPSLAKKHHYDTHLAFPSSLISYYDVCSSLCSARHFARGPGYVLVGGPVRCLVTSGTCREIHVTARLGS